MSEQDRQTRHFPCFIDAFSEAASGLGIPPQFVTWAGIFLTSAVMGRHCWGVNQKGMTYPNLYVMMIAPPGVGKSQTEDLLLPFFKELGKKIAPRHISKASLVDELSESKMEMLVAGKQMGYHHCVIVSSEFIETFPDRYDTHLLGMLSRWWDCPSEVTERKRHLKNPIYITNAACSMITGIQPGILASSFPSDAWHGGFLSRTLFVYEAEQQHFLLRGHEEHLSRLAGKKMSDEVFGKLLSDLNAISLMSGRFNEDSSFVDEYLRWADEDKEEPKPSHPRLLHYNLRRAHQLEKLSLVSAASKGRKLLLGEDYLQAREWLETSEHNIDQVFVEMTMSDDLEIMKDLNQFLFRLTKGQERPMPETKLWTYLAGKVPTQKLAIFLDAAERAGFIKFQAVSGRSYRMVIPLSLDSETLEDV
jgi:hypothetical protein